MKKNKIKNRIKKNNNLINGNKEKKLNILW